MMNIDELRIHIEALIRKYPDLEDDEVFRADMLEAETTLHEVMTDLFHGIEEYKALCDGITARLEELSERKSRFSHRVEVYRELALKILQSANLKKVVLPEATFSQRNGQPQVHGELDPDKLPEDLVRIRREPNKTAIREALLAHREVPGAYLTNAEPTISIKVR